VQVTIYLTEEDSYLINLLEQRSQMERKSRSALILSILEEHFERGKRLGEILIDLGALSMSALETALELQMNTFRGKRLGEVLIGGGDVDGEAIDKALMIQQRLQRTM